MSKPLVAYFSAGGATAKAAKLLAEAAQADLFEIRPKVPYTAGDLDWTDKNSRSSREMRDRSFRPELAEGDARIEDYGVIFLGFPIWWYTAPAIINTFLERYDFSGKTVVLFATSGGSGLGKTAARLRGSVSDSTQLLEGRLLNGRQTVEGLRDWVNRLKL